MPFYTVTFHHKISATCKCGASRSSHDGTGADFGTGGCRYNGCAKFELRDVYEHDLPSSIEEADTNGVAAVLRQAKILGRGKRLHCINRRIEARVMKKLTCFPMASIWHSIVIEPKR